MPVIQGLIGGIPTTSLNDNSNGYFLQGKAGELIDANLHDSGYVASYRGRMMVAATAAAGVTIPISTTTAPTFTLYNPIGSGVVAELRHINIGSVTATFVVSPLLLGYISGIVAGTVPTSTTARTITNANLSGLTNATPQCQLYTTATLSAAPTTFVTFGSISATSGLGPNFNYDVKGMLTLSPGSLVHICGTAAQTQAMTISLLYAEWPI